MANDDTATCARCGQDIHRLDRPWNLRSGFRGEWANRFGFPWCPGRPGETELVPHNPGTGPWVTVSSHPASGLAYQERGTREAGTGGTEARVVRDGSEIVSPSRSVDTVYRAYMARVRHAAGELDTDTACAGVTADTYSDDGEGWFVETEQTSRFAPGWLTEAGPFPTEEAAAAWLQGNAHRLILAGHPTRIIHADYSEE